MQRPQDASLASVIDKMAEFVARNGPEFERAMLERQKDNLKFGFLLKTHELNNFYNQRVREYKLLEERRNMSQQSSINNQPQNIWSGNSEAISSQQVKLREQIIQSEKNLSAQHQVLLQQQKIQIEDAITKAQGDSLNRLASENSISLESLDEILEPIITSCTKESISNGKLWILQQTSNSAKSQIISQYILKKAMEPGAPFTQKLHLIYLINDLLHYCVRKSADDLKNPLESVVVVMFCNATLSASDEQKEKLDKLLSLWSSKANFFDSCAISKLQSPPSSLQEYQNTLFSTYASIISSITQATKAKFDVYQQQHQAFVKHATNQIAILDAEMLKLEQQHANSHAQHIPSDVSRSSQQMIPQMRSDMITLQNMFNNQSFQNPHQPNFLQHQTSTLQQQPDLNNQFQNFNLPPPVFSIPDLSRPPPGFNLSAENSPPQHEPVVEEPEPQPYFTLPAGLMTPLVSLEDYSYRSLDPDRIKLPPPTQPTEKLLSAIEAFYAPPSHERPRDTEGWEKLGLYEYFKIKNSMKKQKEEAILRGDRKRSKSPSPIADSYTKIAKKQKKRIYRSKSPEARTSRSKSLSPEVRPVVAARISRNRKRSRSPSPAPYRAFNKESRFERKKRSVTPPSFNRTATEFIDEGNKGHQMLKKLGWTSGGLGSGKTQGIAEPISGGEVRDRNDLYKGVGMNTNDPYENFRKNRSNNFIVRMKTRGDEKN